jgi:hypothetical protein
MSLVTGSATLGAGWNLGSVQHDVETQVVNGEATHA